MSRGEVERLAYQEERPLPQGWEKEIIIDQRVARQAVRQRPVPLE